MTKPVPPPSTVPSSRAFVLLAAALAVTACGDGEDSSTKPVFRAVDDGLSDNCHPFRSAGACGLPYPASAYLQTDASTETGYRVALESEVLSPSLATDVPFDPVEHNRFDGFSPASPILAYFPEKLDADSLPSQADYTQSLQGDSATLLVDMDSGELVAHFSELDLSADIEVTDRQPLILRPASHLRPSGHYGVAITNKVATLDGPPPARPAGFEQLLRGATSSDPRIERSLSGARSVLKKLESHGVDASDVLLAWDFRTASLKQLTQNALTMRDKALEKAGATGIGFTIVSVEDAPNAEIFKRIRGTFTVPSFLTENDRSKPETELMLGADGLPEIAENAEYPFELVIPASAPSGGPYPLLVYGHGLLGAADQVSSGHVRRFCNDKGYVCIGTDWIGLSEQEEGGIGQNNAAWLGVQDINRFRYVGHRLQQSLVNFMVLTRTAKSILADSQALLPGDLSAVVSPLQVYYYGISQGGIMGASLLAYSPDIERGVVQVGGSAYSLMIQRSVNWDGFFPAIRNAYPDRVDQQLLMALWQPPFDLSEGSGTAWAQGAHEPLPGAGKKRLLSQIAVGDSQVANLAAEIQARTMQIPLLTPSAKPVWGLSETKGGETDAISFWDLERKPPPSTNATPTFDNDVHGDIRSLPENQEQTDVFLRTGQVKNTCAGACSFPGYFP
mgnify:CR=1 FL=1